MNIVSISYHMILLMEIELVSSVNHLLSNNSDDSINHNDVLSKNKLAEWKL